MTEIEIIEIVKASMREKRFLHTEGCVRMAERLAERWNGDVATVRRAAWLHDITKEMPYEQQLQLLSRHGIILTDMQKSEKIIHAFSGAAFAEYELHEAPEICNAVRWHTTARAGMTLCEKLIWLADLTEEGRTFPGVSELRALAFKDLSCALIKGFDMTLGVLIERGSEIDLNMVEARNFELASRI